MAFVRLTDVHQGQHHEDEGLQGDDHDVEDRPSGTGQQVQDEHPGAAQCDGLREMVMASSFGRVCFR